MLLLLKLTFLKGQKRSIFNGPCKGKKGNQAVLGFRFKVCIIAEKNKENFMNKLQNVQSENAEHQEWQVEIEKKLEERGIIAIEGNTVLTSKDVLVAIDVIDALEATRDETEEWNHIKKLQRERTERLSEGKSN